MDGPFPTKHGAAARRMKADRAPFEPTGEPRAIDRAGRADMPAAQVDEFAPAKSTRIDLTTTEAVDARLGARAALKAPNPAIDH